MFVSTQHHSGIPFISIPDPCRLGGEIMPYELDVSGWLEQKAELTWSLDADSSHLPSPDGTTLRTHSS
jgi:hypothetical protein